MASADDFDTSDDVFEAIGDILQSIALDKSEDDIRDLCSQLINLMKPEKISSQTGFKVLDAPVQLADLAATNNSDEPVKSIWVVTRDESLVSLMSFQSLS